MRINIYDIFMKKQCIQLVKLRGVNYPYTVYAKNPSVVAEFMRELFKVHERPEEYVYVLCLDSALKVRGVFELSHGISNTSLCTPPAIFRRLLMLSTDKFILAHNHPSGDVTPSNCDLEINRTISQACEIMKLCFCDSIIVGDIAYYSAAENNTLK